MFRIQLKTPIKFRRVRKHILQSLTKHRMRGFQIQKELSENRINIFTKQQGLLYPLLYRMEHEGFISSTGTSKRYFKITKEGVQWLRRK